MRVLVVGSGIAGLLVALEASEHHDVTLVTKDALGGGSTERAQGGIAAAGLAEAPRSDVSEHIRDTVRAAAGLADPRIATLICTAAATTIRALEERGVRFDRDARGLRLLGREAAHSRARILHADGDATGAEISRALIAAVRGSAVQLREHLFLRELVGGPTRISGADFAATDGSAVRLEADVVILATGGAGELYRYSTNSESATGDGQAAALRAGARLADIEFYQFHPTALALPGSFLISEAVRGEGAVLVDALGDRFMRGLHPDAELAPRDIVARGIADAMARQGGTPVGLDARSLGGKFLATRFPGITSVLGSRGIDWAEHIVPVSPAAHYWMGGIATDAEGRTSIPGLIAVGEVARTGLHGANRLASNSLLEAAVIARRAAAALGTPASHPVDPAPIGRPPRRVSAMSRPSRTEIQDVCWSELGLSRSDSGLRRAEQLLGSWVHTIPLPTTRADQEDLNLLQLAHAIAVSAVNRPGSVGAHWRSDDISRLPTQIIEPDLARSAP